MIQDASKNNAQIATTEGIDFNKLRATIRENFIWIILIFIVTNTIAYLIIRYTKDLYESVSEIKLDVKNDATALGIPNIGADELQNADLISGEIEIIRSRLFLNMVLDSIRIDVGHYSKGDVLNHELFTNKPYLIEFKPGSSSYLNVPIYLEERGDDTFTLTPGESGREITGTYNEPVKLNDLEITIRKDPSFIPGDGKIEFFFIIHSRDRLLSYLINSLTVEPLNFYAKTIRVALKDNNPEKAQAIVNAIDVLYLKYSHEQKNQANKQKIDWLNNELRNIEEKMEGYENYFKQFTLQNKTNNLDEDLKATITSIIQIDSQRYEISRRIVDINQLIEGVQARQFFIPPGLQRTLPDYVFKNLELIQQLLLKQEKLKMAYNETTYAYRESQKDIDSNTARVHEQLASLKADLLKRQQEITLRKQALESQFVNMPDQSTQHSKNERYYKLYEEFYLILMQSKSGFEIAKAGTTTDFKVLSPATLPSRPISPNRMMIAGVGLVTSFTLIVFFIGFLYIINNKITNLQELEKISGVPVLGVVPSSKNTSPGIYVVNHPKSIVSEAIRTLRTNLEFFKSNTPQKVVAISSTVSGEGKSFVATNLGSALALLRKKVLLVDLDMRKTKHNLPYQVNDPSKGMSTVLIQKNDWRDCIVPTGLDFFDYLPSGPNPPNPSELLLDEVFAKTLEEFKKHYDFIILDTPPVGLLTDGIQAMKMADVSIYVFRANYSKREFLLTLQRIISINKFTNLTSVLNAMSSGGEQAYGYGYGYYEDEGGSKGLKKIRELFKL
jgi:tyrosine-protein kinase Etk/Wzc